MTTETLGHLLTRIDRRGESDLPLLGVSVATGVRLRGGDDGRPAPSLDLSGYKVVEPGDIIMNALGKPHGSIGRSEIRGITSPAYWILRAQPTLDSRYAHHLLRSQWAVSRYAGLGKNLPPNQFDIPWETFAKIETWLPTVEEQRRIADFLDDRVARIDQIIAARQQQVRHADRARISLVDSVLTPAHPSGMTRLGRLATIQSGLTVDEKRSNASGGDCYPYLRVANVQAGGLDLAEIKTVVAEEALAKRCTLRPGDVLMTEGGDLDKLGRGTVWHGEISPCLHQNHVFAVRPARELLVADYLALYTQSSAARSYFERTGSKTTNLASTSASKVMALPIPFVPISEQRDLASECQNQLAAVDAGVTALISAVSLLQEYKQSLITAAVTGEFDVTTASTKIPE